MTILFIELTMVYFAMSIVLGIFKFRPGISSFVFLKSWVFVIFFSVLVNNGVSKIWSALLSGTLILGSLLYFICFSNAYTHVKEKAGPEETNIWMYSVFITTSFLVYILGASEYEEIRRFWYLIVILVTIVFCVRSRKQNPALCISESWSWSGLLGRKPPKK